MPSDWSGFVLIISCYAFVCFSGIITSHVPMRSNWDFKFLIDSSQCMVPRSIVNTKLKLYVMFRCSFSILIIYWLTFEFWPQNWLCFCLSVSTFLVSFINSMQRWLQIMVRLHNSGSIFLCLKFFPAAVLLLNWSFCFFQCQIVFRREFFRISKRY